MLTHPAYPAWGITVSFVYETWCDTCGLCIVLNICCRAMDGSGHPHQCSAKPRLVGEAVCDGVFF